MSYRLSPSIRAISALRLTATHLSSPYRRSFSLASYNFNAQPTGIHLRPTPRILSRAELHRLHRLSALNPPPADSPEERELLQELGELVGLMDMVKDVELPAMTDEEVGRLLAGGVGSVEFDGEDGEFWDDLQAPQETMNGKEEDGTGCIQAQGAKEPIDSSYVKKDRELLEFATNRRGDYYVSRKAAPTPDNP